MCQLTRQTSSTRPCLGMSPLPGAADRRSFFDYCSRDVVPPEGGASRNRETIYDRHMGPFAENVKKFKILGPLIHDGRA
jgi:hypothetical protein